MGGHAGVPAQDPEQSAGRGGVVKVKLDLVKAKKYLPPKASLWYEPKSDRIRGAIGKGHGASHSCSMSVGQDVACRVVLEWLRARAKSLNKEVRILLEFPYELPDN